METTVLTISTGSGEAVRGITGECVGFLASIDAGDGLLHVWVPHATAGIAVLETGAGSDTDLLVTLEHLMPRDQRWVHRHGSAGHGRDHVLPALIAPHASIPVLGGAMALGRWQSVCLVDTNGDNEVRSVRLSFLRG